MQPESSASTIDFDNRIRRTRGRGGRVHSLTAKVNKEELCELEAFAFSHGKAAGEWAREVLLAAARRPSEDILLTELLGTRIFLLTLLKRVALGQPTTEADYSQIAQQIQTKKIDATREVIRQYSRKPPAQED